MTGLFKYQAFTIFSIALNKIVGVSCLTGTTTGQIEEYSAGSSGLQNPGDGCTIGIW
ncbi:MAG: hypothetical protein HZB19_18185 [Chloroflexi bacterium]|nr:hypothetical protein [Chloroflexota bacterium]